MSYMCPIYVSPEALVEEAVCASEGYPIYVVSYRERYRRLSEYMSLNICLIYIPEASPQRVLTQYEDTYSRRRRRRTTTEGGGGQLYTAEADN